MQYPEITHIAKNPTLEGQVELKQNIVYSSADGVDRVLTLFLPWSLQHPDIPTTPRPLIVFVQGSGWQTPNFDYEIPQLAAFAKAGYIVATVGHRDIFGGHPYPAFLLDVKSAIRYLRAHAAEYAIDPDHVVIWGTSSGGNTALLVGLTANDPAYESDEFQGISDAVNAVISCFTPTDVVNLLGVQWRNVGDETFLEAALGPDREGWDAKLREASPVHWVQPGKTYPPFLLLHGTADEVVPYEQMLTMYHKLLDNGVEAKAIAVDGALHEHDFWSPTIYEMIADFIREKI